MRKLFNRAYAHTEEKTEYPTSTAEAIEKTKIKTRLEKRRIRGNQADRDRIRRWAIQVGAFSQSSAARLAAYGAAGRFRRVSRTVGSLLSCTSRRETGYIGRKSLGCRSGTL